MKSKNGLGKFTELGSLHSAISFCFSSMHSSDKRLLAVLEARIAALFMHLCFLYTVLFQHLIFPRPISLITSLVCACPYPYYWLQNKLEHICSLPADMHHTVIWLDIWAKSREMGVVGCMATFGWLH